MYGFPTQTEQETVDALEVVRQLFEAGALRSGYWHRFAMTVHSPVGRDPAAFGVEALPLPDDAFARNEQGFVDPTGVDHDMLGEGLGAALYAYMVGEGLDEPVESWFEAPVPGTTEAPDRILRALADAPFGTAAELTRRRARLVWLGEPADWLVEPETDAIAGVAVHGDGGLVLESTEPVARWLVELLDLARPGASPPITLGDALERYPGGAAELLRSANWRALRDAGLLLV